MKKVIIIFLSAIIFSFKVTSSPYLINPDKPEQLIEQMYSFFTNTLWQHYKIHDEAELFRRFLADYFDSYMVTDLESFSYFKLEVNRKELKRINEILFIRDFSHYYYFFPELIRMHFQNSIEAKEFLKKEYPGVPAGIISPGIYSPGEKRFFTYFYDTHSVSFVHDGGFLIYIAGKDYRVSDFILKMNEKAGEVPFFNFSAFLVKTPASEELKSREVREIIAVVFWKYLCLQAGVEFHVP